MRERQADTQIIFVLRSCPPTHSHSTLGALPLPLRCRTHKHTHSAAVHAMNVVRVANSIPPQSLPRQPRKKRDRFSDLPFVALPPCLAHVLLEVLPSHTPVPLL